MLKILILAAVAYFFYRALKGHLFPREIGPQAKPPAPVEDEMIRDPVCAIYFPKRQGVQLDVRGEKIYFCSDKCRQRYLEKNDSD